MSDLAGRAGLVVKAVAERPRKNRDAEPHALHIATSAIKPAVLLMQSSHMDCTTFPLEGRTVHVVH